MKIINLIICVLIPIGVSIWLTQLSAKRLRKHPLITQSTRSLTVFIISRFIYWVGFGILIAAFILAINQFGVGGAQTRENIAHGIPAGDGTSNFLLSEMSNFFLPAIFLSLFIAVLALAIIGRKVVTLLPEDKRPGEEFTKFRFTFVLMALSLIIPPLIFGSLLLI